MSAPAVKIPGSYSIPSVAPVYVDGIPIASVATPSAKASSTQDFWSSQPRLPGDPHAEQLIVSLAQPRLINYITMDLPHFPHILTVFWWDGAQWQPVIGTGHAPLTIVTSGSVPSVVDNPAALNAGMNPYHYGAGHWVHYNESIQPVTTTKLMLSGIRPPKTSSRQVFPVNPARKVTAYPLGVQNLDFGSRLLSAADAPPMPRSPATLTMRQPFTTTLDVNGSPVQVAIRENRASDLLRGATWRCGPQPSSSSVACLYLDSRGEDGNPQLIDRFYLAPVTSGVRFNLYYSPVPPPPGTPFTVLDDPILPSLLNPGGASLPVAASQGIVFPDVPSWLTLSNQAAGTIADAPWWAGIEIMPGFGSSDPGTYIVADAGLLQLYYSDGTWTVTMPPAGPPGEPNQPSGATLATWDFEFAPGDRLQFIAGFDGQAFFVWTPRASLAMVPAVLPVPPAPVFCFGGLQNVQTGYPVLTGNHTLTNFILKQEQINLTTGGIIGIPPDFAAFAADADAYVTPPLGTLSTEGSTTDNAVARFSPDFVLGTTNPWGFTGGLGSAYEACPWTPVQRDYKLATGYVEFNPVLAAAWKFEFTALQAEPYEYFQPSPQLASFFPPQQVPTAAQANPASAAVLDAGLEVGKSVAPSISFNDAPVQSPPATPGVALPTEALYATDPASAGSLAQAGGALYNFQPWQPPAVIPSASVAGPTAYQQPSITVTSRVAYFVALSSIAMFRLDYTAADDTDQYLETFADTHNINPLTLGLGGLAWQAGTGLTAPSNLAGSAVTESVVFNSGHNITGVQFATVQSEPVQLLDDPDFSAPGFAGWGPAGDALPLAASPVNAQLGNMVTVTRAAGITAASTPLTWAQLEGSYASWSAVQSGFPSWYDFGQPTVGGSMGGIGYTAPPVPTNTAGRVYAAARVFTAGALSAPLYLQLLDGATGMLIAEAEQTVAAGGVTEWYTGFTLGQELASQATWAGVEAEYPTWASIAAASPAWDVIDTSETPLGTTVTVQLVQLDATSDSWDVDNISVFEDALVWEFSNDGGTTWYQAFDIRNNPRGVVTFPPANEGSATQLQWRLSAYAPGVSVSALAIRPWYTSWPHGIMPRPAGIGHGPNISPLDHYPAIENDPRWQLSSEPIPADWFFSVRQALALSAQPDDFPGPAAPAADAGLGSALVYEAPVLAAEEPETFTDIYTDVYTDTYAPADAGDVFTDTYADEYGEDYLPTTGTVWTATATFDATGYLTATALDIPPLAAGLGADLGLVQASDPSIAAWTEATGLPMPVRRVTMGNQIPATLAESVVAGDAGVRRVLLDFRPDATTTPGQLNDFLASCQEGGLEAAVSIWAGPDQCFTNLDDYLTLLPDYVGAIHQNGYSHVFTMDNASIVANQLAAWYPGDGLVDIIAPFFWCSGPAPGSGGATLTVAANFAYAHAKPFGLAGFGADLSAHSPAQAEAFLAYIRQVLITLRSGGQAVSDLIYLGTGTYSLVDAPAALLAGYEQIAAAL